MPVEQSGLIQIFRKQDVRLLEYVRQLERILYTLQPHYYMPHYYAVFIITWPCDGSPIDYFAYSKQPHYNTISLITRSASMDPRDSVKMRLYCM